MGIFSHCQISLDLDATQVPFKKKQLLRKQVTDNGGVISYILTKKTTHLVASNGPKTADSYKGRTALKQGVPIVSVSFIEKCVEEGKLLDHDDFLLVGKTTSMQFSSGKITSAKTHQEPKKQIKVSSFNINKLKVWPWGSVDAPAYLEDKYEVAKSILLQKTDVRSKEKIFCQLELHAVPEEVFNLTESSQDSEPEIEYTFRVFTHRGVLDNIVDEDSGTRDVRYCSTSEEALELYSFLHRQQRNMSKCKKVVSRWIGSPKYRQTQLSIGAQEKDEMSEEVASLVASLWKETLGELEDILAVDIKTLTAEKISKAESLLLQIKKTLDSRSDDKDDRRPSIADLSQEFYSEIPHKREHKKDIQSKSMIAKKQDLCQLIKDVVSVSETTNWSQRSSVESKYRALRCHISCLPHNHPQYYDVKNLIVSTQGEKPAEILRVFAVTRPLELTSFDTKLHNSRLLFHASRPANFVGILSRGLVLPKVVVDDFGGERTDAGMLGSGIYFADNFSTSAKYSHASHTRGTRLMTVNQVALGECYQTNNYQKDFTKPPEGFHSVHGVKNNGTNNSDFKDDEYAVYSTTQQRLCYVVEFTLPGDKPTTDAVDDIEGAVHHTEDSDVEVEDDNTGDIDLSDVQSIEDPLSKVQPGLLSNSDQPVPLKAVHVRARLLDLAAQVVVLQVYANDSNSPIEAKYVFPLDEQAAVCGFEAFINDKHIVGEVKEKETAHKEYKEAISKGHGAYLMDEEKPDVFTVSVGNLPPKTTVVIKITYVAELSVDGDKVLFGLPGSVAPWRKDAALAQETQTDVTTVKVDKDTERALSVHISVEMPYDIRSLESPTHPIKRKQTASKATVCLTDDCHALDDGFQLLIGLAEIHVPRMWVEKHPQDSDSQACMLTFYPEFEAEKNDQSEVVLLMDLSNSMRGGSVLQEAKKIVLLALHHLPKDWRFNIVVFGTDFEELFSQSQLKTPENMKSARNFLQGLSASMGNTDVWRPLRTYFMLKSGALRNIFFISDGHVSNEDATLDAVRGNCRHTRVFTFGVSATANKYLLRAMSTAGAGAFEFFDSKTKSKWEGKVRSQLSKASQPVLSSVKVDWCQFDDDAPEPVQAPNHITSLFSGSRQVVYGFVPHCTQATLRANNDGKEVSTMVSTHELSITEGKILHQLTARNIIRDWEEGALAADRTQHEARKAEQKSYIIELSKEYSIVTQFTSFVAVEVRDKEDEGKPKTGVDVEALLSKEEVDVLQYLGWQEDVPLDAPESMTPEDEKSCMEDLLKKAEIETFVSVFRAESLYDKIKEMLSKLKTCYREEDLPLLIRTAKQLGHFYKDIKHDDDMATHFFFLESMFDDSWRYKPVYAGATADEDLESDDDFGKCEAYGENSMTLECIGFIAGDETDGDETDGDETDDDETDDDESDDDESDDVQDEYEALDKSPAYTPTSPSEVGLIRRNLGLELELDEACLDEELADGGGYDSDSEVSESDLLEFLENEEQEERYTEIPRGRDKDMGFKLKRQICQKKEAERMIDPELDQQLIDKEEDKFEEATEKISATTGFPRRRRRMASANSAQQTQQSSAKPHILGQAEPGPDAPPLALARRPKSFAPPSVGFFESTAADQAPTGKKKVATTKMEEARSSALFGGPFSHSRFYAAPHQCVAQGISAPQKERVTLTSFSGELSQPQSALLPEPIQPQRRVAIRRAMFNQAASPKPAIDGIISESAEEAPVPMGLSLGEQEQQGFGFGSVSNSMFGGTAAPEPAMGGFGVLLGQAFEPQEQQGVSFGSVSKPLFGSAAAPEPATGGLFSAASKRSEVAMQPDDLTSRGGSFGGVSKPLFKGSAAPEPAMGGFGVPMGQAIGFGAPMGQAFEPKEQEGFSFGSVSKSMYGAAAAPESTMSGLFSGASQGFGASKSKKAGPSPIPPGRVGFGSVSRPVTASATAGFGQEYCSMFAVPPPPPPPSDGVAPPPVQLFKLPAAPLCCSYPSAAPPPPPNAAPPPPPGAPPSPPPGAFRAPPPSLGTAPTPPRSHSADVSSPERQLKGMLPGKAAPGYRIAGALGLPSPTFLNKYRGSSEAPPPRGTAPTTAPPPFRAPVPPAHRGMLPTRIDRPHDDETWYSGGLFGVSVSKAKKGERVFETSKAEWMIMKPDDNVSDARAWLTKSAIQLDEAEAEKPQFLGKEVERAPEEPQKPFEKDVMMKQKKKKMITRDADEFPILAKASQLVRVRRPDGFFDRKAPEEKEVEAAERWMLARRPEKKRVQEDMTAKEFLDLSCYDQQEISTAISARMGFDEPESKFRKHNGDYKFELVLKLLKHQNEDGSWPLFMGIEEHVGIRLKPVKKLLKEAGVNSLGEEVASKIQKLVATYLVILYLNQFLARSPTMSGQERELIAKSVLKAERFVSLAEAEHPSLAHRLELGSSWDEVCRDIFKIIGFCSSLP